MTKDKGRSFKRNRMFKFFASIHLEKVLVTSLCLWALSVQIKYRVLGTSLSLVVPWIGIALATLSLFILINEYFPDLFIHTPFKKMLNRIEWGTKLLIRIFVYYSLFLLANGLLDVAPAIYRPAKIESIAAGEWHLDLPIPYRLATLVFSDSEKKSRFFLNTKEYHRLWGGEEVLVVTYPGYFGLPWISSIEKNIEVYSKKTLALTPTASEAWRNLIWFYVDRERWEEAASAMYDYLEIYPADDTFPLGVAGDLSVAGQYSISIPILEGIVERHPRTYKAYQLLGYALAWNGQRKQAAIVLEKSIPLDPANWEAYYHLGYVYNDSGKLEKAEENFIKLLERRPHFPEVEKLLANIRHLRKLRKKIKTRNDAAAAETDSASQGESELP